MNNLKSSFWAFIGAAIAYAVTLPLSIVLMREMDFGVLSMGIALLPMIPVIFGVIVLVRMIDALDELERRVQLQALAISGMVTGLGTFAYSLLERTGLPPLSLTWVLPILIALWGVGNFIARRRYR